jgi:hypothetical protein
MIDEEVLKDSLFSDSHENEKGFYESVESRLTALGISYPEFAEIEPSPTCHTISWSEENEEYTASGLDLSWERLEDAYRHIQKMGHDAAFDDSALNSPDVESSLGADMVFLKPDTEDARSAGLLIGPVNHREIAFYHYYGFLRTAKAYTEDPTDFLKSYYFLQGHPAFWTRSDPERFPYSWNTSSGTASISSFPTVDRDGNVVISMEHGSAVPPLRASRYHDPRLDVWAPTFEQAYIEMAARTHKYFTLDGEKREDVHYEPQPWEVELSKRLGRYNEESKAND